MSDADVAFDATMSAALQSEAPITLTNLELGPWTYVCAVGEDQPSEMLVGQKARPGEGAFDYFIDAGSHWGDGPGKGALAFSYPDGVEVRPLADLAVNMGAPINICVPRERAVLVYKPDHGWAFSHTRTSNQR